MPRAGLWLVLLALAMRAVVPPGYMLGAGDGHTITIMLCGPGSGQELALDLATGQVTEDDGHHAPRPHAAEHCVFAVAGAPALAPAAVLPPEPISRRLGVARDFVFAAIRPDAGPPLPARGPPSHT